MRCSVGARLSSTGWTSDHLFEDVPDLVVLALEHLLGGLDRVGVAELLEPADDERLEQFERDLLRQAALVQLQFGADDDHRTGRVVDALAEQVLAEAALLALDHVGQGLERAVDEPSTGPLQRLLSNSASTDCCSIRFSLRMMTSGAFRSTQLLQPVVAVDDAAVEVVQVATWRSCRESSSTSGRRSGGMTGMHVEDHPLGLVAPSRGAASTVFSRLTRSFDLLLRCLVAASISFRAGRGGPATGPRGRACRGAS